MPQPSQNSYFSRITQGIGLGALLLTGLGCDAGLTFRPKAPTLVAQAQFGASASTSSSSSSSTYAQPAPPPSSAPMSNEGTAGFPAEPAPALASSYAQSGGMNAANAPVVALGTRIEGRVSKGAPRFYAIDLAVGDSLEFTMYVRKIGENSTVRFRFLEPDNVKLVRNHKYITAPTSEYERSSMHATAGQAGRHILKVSADKPVEFRVDVVAQNLAAR